MPIGWTLLISEKERLEERKKQQRSEKRQGLILFLLYTAASVVSSMGTPKLLSVDYL